MGKSTTPADCKAGLNRRLMVAQNVDVCTLHFCHGLVIIRVLLRR